MDHAHAAPDVAASIWLCNAARHRQGAPQPCICFKGKCLTERDWQGQDQGHPHPAGGGEAESGANQQQSRDCVRGWLSQVHYLQLPGSCDDVMWPTVASKLRIVGATLDGRLTGTATGAFLSPSSRPFSF